MTIPRISEKTLMFYIHPKYSGIKSPVKSLSMLKAQHIKNICMSSLKMWKDAFPKKCSNNVYAWHPSV